MTRGAHFKEAVRTAYIAAHPGEKFTDAALAKRAHVSDFTLRRLWAGDVPSLSTLLAVANAADMSALAALIAVQGRDVTQPADVASEVAAAIRAQTAMLERVLDRLEPPTVVESRVEPREAVELAEAEAELEADRRVSGQQRRRSDRQNGVEP